MTGKPWRPSMSREEKYYRARFELLDEALHGSSIRYVDRSGRTMSEGDWREASDDRTYVRVAWDTFGEVIVSTVWFGVDHRALSGAVDSMIFETVVMDERTSKGEPPVELATDDLPRRYPTEEEALAGHREVCASTRSTLFGD